MKKVGGCNLQLRASAFIESMCDIVVKKVHVSTHHLLMSFLFNLNES